MYSPFIENLLHMINPNKKLGFLRLIFYGTGVGANLTLLRYASYF